MKHKLLCGVLLSLILCTSSEAVINRKTVEAAWTRIAKADGFKVVKIHYEKDKSPNAWVAFKSKNNFSVHVTQGLMKILRSEDEIAGVLGHEIGHVKLGHYSKGVGRSVGLSFISVLFGEVFGNAGAVAGSVGTALVESGFSREQEVEADDYGTNLLKKAGYDPYGLYNAMKAFADNKYVTRPSGFNSHPPTDRRLKHLKQKAKEVAGKNDKKQ